MSDIEKKLSAEYDEVTAIITAEVLAIQEKSIQSDRFKFIINSALLDRRISQRNFPVTLIADSDSEKNYWQQYIQSRWQSTRFASMAPKPDFISATKFKFPITITELEAMRNFVDDEDSIFEISDVEDAQDFFEEFQKNNSTLQPATSVFPMYLENGEESLRAMGFRTRASDTHTKTVQDTVTGRNGTIRTIDLVRSGQVHIYGSNNRHTSDLQTAVDTLNDWLAFRVKYYIGRGLEGVYIEPPFSANVAKSQGAKPKSNSKLFWNPLKYAAAGDEASLPFREVSVDGIYRGAYYWYTPSGGLFSDILSVFKFIVSSPLIKFVPVVGQVAGIAQVGLKVANFGKNIVEGNINLKMLASGISTVAGVAGFDASKITDKISLAVKGQNLLESGSILEGIVNAGDLISTSGIDLKALENIGANITDPIIDFVEPIKDVADSIIDGVTGVAKPIIGTVENIIEGVPEVGLIKDFGNFITSGNAETLGGEIKNTLGSIGGILGAVGIGTNTADKELAQLKSEVNTTLDQVTGSFFRNSNFTKFLLPAVAVVGGFFLVKSMNK